MNTQTTRREILRGSLALAGLGVLGIPEWALPALAQGETPLPLTAIPENVRWETPPDRRTLDVSTIDGPFTPRDKFATTQHYGHPEVNPATFKLKVSGLVDRPKALSLDDLKKLGSTELGAVLDAAGVKAAARDVVFFGADHGEEEVEWRTQKYKIDYQFGRSLTREKALSADPFIAWALNGEPLSKHQGAPLRLIVPGWYGVSNVKWLSEIHPQEAEYLGKYQARWYRTVWTEMVDGELKVNETAVTHMQLKSFVARVTRNGNGYKVLAVVLNDGTPIKSVEVKVDEGPWQMATMDPTTKDRFGWKFYTYTWNGATPGDHTLISRATDITGKVQPTAKDLESKKSFLEENSQSPRKLKIA